MRTARPQPGRPVRHPPDARRRHQVLLQGGPACPTGPTGACSSWRPFLSLVPAFLVFSVDPDRRRRSPSEQQGTVEHLRPRDLPAARRPADRRAAHPGLSSIAVYGVMLAGWSSGSKYPLLGSVRASAQMVSYEAALGLVGRRRRAAGRLAVDPRHRDDPGRRRVPRRPPALERHRHRRRAVRDLPDRRHRRAEPAAVRPRRGRAGAGRRLPHRVLARSASPSSSWPSS